MLSLRVFLITVATILVGGTITADAQPAMVSPVPEAMPFDIPYGAPITLAEAQKAAAAAEAEAKKHNWKMAIAIVGPSGDLIHFELMDGTQYASIKIAQAKALTAAVFRRSSKTFADGINGNGPGPAQLSLLAIVGGAASEGGFPIVENGKLVGAIGASGGMSSQDGVVAQAGMKALTDH